VGGATGCRARGDRGIPAVTRSSRRPPTSIFFEVFALGQAVRQVLMSTMSDAALTPEEYAIYSAIFEAEALTPTQMAARLGMPLTTVMERVRLLETRGHARRVKNERDGRSYHLVLTAQGLAAHRHANARFEIAYQRFLDALGGDESRAHAHMTRLRSAAERATELKAKGRAR
jgi:DNA-binding MarR family transcriptional regulator